MLSLYFRKQVSYIFQHPAYSGMEQTCTCLQSLNTAGRSNFRSLSIGSVPLSIEHCLISQSLCQDLDWAELTHSPTCKQCSGTFLSLDSWSRGVGRLCLLRDDLLGPGERLTLFTGLLLGPSLFWTPLKRQSERKSWKEKYHKQACLMG